MSEYQAQFLIRVMSRVLGVSSSGYCAFLKRKSSMRAQANIYLLALVRDIHHASNGTYRAIRIARDLREANEAPMRVGKNRVARLMRIAGLRGEARRRFVRTTTPGNTTPRPSHLVNRNFAANGPDQL